MTNPTATKSARVRAELDHPVIDADGHIHDERMADALMGLRRFSPKVIFLGSYPRADRAIVHYPERYSDDVFIEARDWLRGLISGAPDA